MRINRDKLADDVREMLGAREVIDVCPKQLKLDTMYIDIAERISQMSYAKRKKVGGVLVRDNNIISFGWNGMPSGYDNCCENDNNETKPEVLHAELNLFSKLAKSSQASLNSTLYLTLSPCMECAKLIIQSDVSRVVYRDEYRIMNGAYFLHDAGIQIERYIGENN